MNRLVCLALVAATSLQAQGAPGAPRAALFAEPSPSPDGREIAFSSGGDIWIAPAAGGDARLVVAHAANDFRPRWSPDGTQLGFVSTRSGNGDIYLLDLRTNALRRLTFDDGLEQLDAWSPDGAWIYFSSSARDIAGMHDVLRVRATGGTPMAVAGDRYASEYWAAPAPDGQRLAITARGVTSGQWWRRGSSHLDEAELWLVTTGAVPTYSRLSTSERPGKGRDVWPMWAPDGRTLYFVSDRGGVENLYAQPVGGAARALTTFTDGRVLWPQITRSGSTILFERDFQLWSLSVADGRVAPLQIALRGAATTPAPERLALSAAVDEFDLSPDAKKLALVVRGEIFVADAKEGGDGVRVTHSTAAEAFPVWAPDSRRVLYTSWKSGVGKLYVYDFGTRTESELTTGGDDLTARWSPDGKAVAFVRNGVELRLVDVATGTERLVARAVQFGRVPFAGPGDFAFSPDGQHLAYLDVGARGFLNAFVVPVSGGNPQQVSFLANAFGGTISWSRDARALYFSNSQRTEDSQVIRVDLVPRSPVFRETKFDALFPAESAAAPAAGRAASPPAASAPATKPSVQIVTEGLRRRAQALPLGVDAFAAQVSPDGKQLALIANAAGRTQLWTWSIDESADEPPQIRQVTTSTGGKGNLQWSPDSKELWFLSGDRVQVVGVESRQVRSIAVTAALETDFAREKDEVFREVWTWTRDNFYDPAMHGVDWTAARVRYAPVVAAARTPDELRRALTLLIGELNASHTGVGGPAAQPPSLGRLGVDFDRSAYEADRRLRVASVLPLGPAALAGGIAPGDFLVAVNGAPVGEANLDSLLSFTTGRRVNLSVAATADGRNPRTVTVLPVNTGAEKALRYRAWVEERRAYVERASGGRFGYVHMLDMGAGSLAQLYVDLDAENHGREGVVIDIRNNNGGFVNAYALDVFSRRPYLTMEWRGRPEVPARLQLGQRAFEKPTVLVTNQHSLSDAEDFAEGYRTLGLGPIVGEPTAGWIIYTSNFTLFDGTTLRMPFIRIRDAAGKDMELVPRPVDVRVDRPMGEGYGGTDSQLDAAIAALRQRLR